MVRRGGRASVNTINTRWCVAAVFDRTELERKNGLASRDEEGESMIHSSLLVESTALFCLNLSSGGCAVLLLLTSERDGGAAAALAG